MITRFQSLRHNNEDGFTLIELLIVVVIIGILAAIAIPIFLNQQKAAIAASVKSDVRNTVTEVATYLAKNPKATLVQLGNAHGDGLLTKVQSEGNYIEVGGFWKNYSVIGENEALTTDGELDTYTYWSNTGKYVGVGSLA